MSPDSNQAVLLFTDIAGSTRLWEETPERMRLALARHDALARSAIERCRGTVVKMTGDGVYAAFRDALDAVGAAIELQRSLVDPAATHGVWLPVRCGLHAGTVERRDDDIFGSAVNRAARIMDAAHGGQIVLSQAVFDRVAERLPRQVSLRDLGLARLRDLARPERVYQVVHPDLRREFPVLRSLAATPNNLPQQVSSFIARERELAEIRTLLATQRLVIVVGVGGLGKTRLSLQVAADMLDDCADGVWFVELAPIADAQLVVQAVASVLGVKEEPDRPVLDALVKYVADRQLLVVLDNCEHLLHPCAELANTLLRAGPQLKILATSREPLHVHGEATFSLSTLPVPGPQRHVPVETLTHFGAVHLFVDRARAAQSAFRLTDENASTVVEICRQLDGIPLALELAATHVRALSVEAIAARLSDRFRLLARGDGTALPRQQTLRASIDWSYDLLTEGERALLRRLAVFAGGFSLEAAEAVGMSDSVAQFDVLLQLTHLVEKSLVETDDDRKRYRLLETVRQYALERLVEAGDGDDARNRHLRFYLALAESADRKLRDVDHAEQDLWWRRLDNELENLVAAHVWCDQADDGAQLGLRLVWSIGNFLIDASRLEFGYRLATEALARPGGSGRNLARRRVLDTAGLLGYMMGKHGDARRIAEEGLSIALELDDRRGVASTLTLLGRVSVAQGDLAGARRHLEAGLVVAQELGQNIDLSYAFQALAELYRFEGDFDAAEPLYNDSLALDRKREDREACATNLLNLAMVSIGRGFEQRARAFLREAIAIIGELNARSAGQGALDIAASLASVRGQWERAARLGGAAAAQREASGLLRDPVDEAFLAPLIAQAPAKLAPRTYKAAESAGRALSYDQAIAEVGAWLDDTSGSPGSGADAVA